MDFKVLKNPLILLFIALIVGILFYIVLFSLKSYGDQDKLASVHSSYVKGERANTWGERKDAFNSALEEYTELENAYQPHFGNGKLYYNIGNTYFQLSEYPLAVLYYYKSLALMPRSEKTKNNLRIALTKLGVVPKEEPSAFSRFFILHQKLSLPEKFQLFFILSFTAFVMASLFIWTQLRWLRKGAILFTFVAALFLLSLSYTYYLKPIEAVLIHSSSLYRDAGFQYAKVQQEPVLSGEKLEVYEVAEEGKWLKVVTPSGDLGYIPTESVRIINEN